MAGRAALVSLCGAFFLVVVCSSSLPWCLAVEYTVGDSSGWKSSGYNYSAWAREKVFVVGDTLRFNYTKGAHNVAQVSAGDYSNCTAAKAISTDSSGSTTVSLTTEGTHYFICGVSEHCTGGMKLAVTVLRDSTRTTLDDDPPPVSSCARRVSSPFSSTFYFEF